MNSLPFAAYDEALDWVHGLLRFGQKPGLERMQWMLKELNHPERNVPFVHVAGTNGKGSTCAFLTQMLLEAGYSVGSFTSPYLDNFRERICYNQQMISEQEFLQLANQVKPLVDRCADSTSYGPPTEFEVVTLIAILYFATVKRPAVVIWEAGLGGRLDSTNVVHPLVSVITNVGTDHADVLGHAEEQIAGEKAGIIKPGVPVVVGETSESAYAVIEAAARARRSSVYRFGKQFRMRIEESSRGLEGLRFRYNSLYRRHEAEYELSMLGDHQAANAAVALMTIDLLKEFYAFLLEEEEIARGLQRTHWPGRLEIVARRPLLILDGAHNTEGMEALAKSITQLFGDRSSIRILIATLADKPLQEMGSVLRHYGPQHAHLYLTTFDFPRAAACDQIAEAYRAADWPSNQVTAIHDWRPLLMKWLREAEEQDHIVVVCGSLYFISQVRTVISTFLDEAGE
ncbi:MAG: bifunctional folylpolyglutamate synthase/dihydrofolate synthase [Brevibacillus sp.]|nr:bifunctional folylpolyglutamate synthase/dihydrofolate synthase [Brevibacillus sp.]